MIPQEDPYGWGVSGIPMSRTVRSTGPASRRWRKPAGALSRTLAEDFPWGLLLFCIAMTGLSLIALLLLSRIPAVPPPPPPLELAVRLQDEPREVPPAPVPASPERVVPPRRPSPSPPKAAQPTPPPKPQPTAVSPPHAAPPPPAAFRPKVAEKVQLPLPARTVPQRRPEPKEMPLPQSTLQVAIPSAAHLPAVSAHRRSSPSPALPSPLARKAALRITLPQTELTGPALGNFTRRSQDAEDLPFASVRLTAASAAQLPTVASRLATKRYQPRRTETASLAPQHQGALASRTRTTADVPPPAATETGLVTEGASDRASLPEKDRAVGVFARSDSEQLPNRPAFTPGTARQQRSVAPSPRPARAYDFLDKIAPADLDPAVRISLNRLSTCLDPEEEMTLKSRLAAMLSRPTVCRAGGVVFSVHFPESAYSIHIDLYNYEWREFPDRCAALTLALKSCEVKK